MGLARSKVKSKIPTGFRVWNVSSNDEQLKSDEGSVYFWQEEEEKTNYSLRDEEQEKSNYRD